MRPENILQADLLDIIFTNRNKEYGAYALRKKYDVRLLKSFLMTILFAAALSITHLVYSTYYKDKPSVIDGVPVHQFEMIKPAVPENKKELPKEFKKPLKQLATEVYVVPQIVKDDLADKGLPELTELDNKIIGTTNIEGLDANANEVVTSIDDGKSKAIGTVEIIEKVEPEAPLIKAEIMPEFPGGMDAFKKFMLRHLRQADLTEGEKVVVKVQFVVEADGAISKVNVLQTASGLESEVLRVINKMPKWKPGVQNGHFVAVYFTLPVTFLGPEL